MKYLVALLSASLSVPAFSQTIASFRGDAQHSGIYQQVGAPVLHGIKWKFKTGSRVASSPAAYNGRAYFGSYDGNTYAVDAKSGEQRWTFASEGERRFSGRHLHGSDPAGESMPDPFDFKFRTGNVVQASPAIADGLS